uniref:Serine/threonine-protein kinase RIO2 n=1 Tax=Ananas comosus var. bracteatus TaxID=296719 RepID=A0A6V7QYD8_ANACO
MKLDVDALRYLSKDDFRVLTAVEMGMRNHEIVPAELVERIAGLRHGGTYKVLRNLLKHKLVHHDSSKYDGFRLTYLGYDFLAIKTLVNRGVFAAVGRQIGVGKESDIFEVATEDGTVLAIKLHRLGRVSFRAVKSKRDYLVHRSNYNWLYLSRLAALKEYAFMKALGEHGFPVPAAVDCNRHSVVMSLVKGYPLECNHCAVFKIKQLQNPDEVFETIIGLVVRLAEHGLIHCDFNEFNLMIDDDEKVTMIDFPQMVSVSHRNAKMYFDRDVECIFKFFSKRFNISYQEDRDEEDEKSAGFLDKELAASGFTKRDQDEIEKFIEGGPEPKDGSSSDDESSGKEQTADEDNETVTTKMVALQLADQQVKSSCRNDEERVEENLDSCNVKVVRENEPTASGEQEDSNDLDNSDDDDDGSGDAELVKHLNKQRKRAVAAARGRRALASRNSYKDKGGKSSHNSKIQKQVSKW